MWGWERSDEEKKGCFYVVFFWRFFVVFGKKEIFMFFWELVIYWVIFVIT